MSKFNYCSTTQTWIFGSEQRILRRQITKAISDFVETNNISCINLALALAGTEPEEIEFCHFVHNFLKK